MKKRIASLLFTVLLICAAIPFAAYAASEDGYYLAGRLNGKDCWTVTSITPDMKLTESETADEYKIDWVFREGDEIKVVRIENGAITAWYKDGTDNSYVVRADKAGEGTLYFRCEGNVDWSYFYFAIKPIILPVEPAISGTSSTLSGDNLAIVTGVAGLAIGLVGGLLLGKKKKKSALAGGAENTDEE